MKITDMTKNKFFSYALNSSPLHPQLHPDQGTCYYSSPTEGGGGQRRGITWFSRGEGGVE